MIVIISGQEVGWHFIRGCKRMCGLLKVSVINVALSDDYRNY